MGKLNWVDYLFEDRTSGEQFLVEVIEGDGAAEEAHMIAEENFEDPKMIDVISVEEGEALGLDTY